jgi:hypothetical protein
MGGVLYVPLPFLYRKGGVGMVESKFWRRTVDDLDGNPVTDILVYTEDLGVLKEKSIKKEPDGMYFHPKNKMKLTAVQFVCMEGDATHKALVKYLKLTPEHEVKEEKKKRTRRTKAQMEEARARGEK